MQPAFGLVISKFEYPPPPLSASLLTGIPPSRRFCPANMEPEKGDPKGEASKTGALVGFPVICRGAPSWLNSSIHLKNEYRILFHIPSCPSRKDFLEWDPLLTEARGRTPPAKTQHRDSPRGSPPGWASSPEHGWPVSPTTRSWPNAKNTSVYVY